MKRLEKIILERGVKDHFRKGVKDHFRKGVFVTKIVIL